MQARWSESLSVRTYEPILEAGVKIEGGERSQIWSINDIVELVTLVGIDV